MAGTHEKPHADAVLKHARTGEVRAWPAASVDVGEAYATGWVPAVPVVRTSSPADISYLSVEGQCGGLRALEALIATGTHALKSKWDADHAPAPAPAPEPEAG